MGYKWEFESESVYAWDRLKARALTLFARADEVLRMRARAGGKRPKTARRVCLTFFDVD